MKRKISKGRSKDKKVLVVAYYFPPIGGAGVLRPLKLAKYLKYFGWQPVVLTVKPFAYHVYDRTNLREVDFPVFESESFDPARILFLLGKRRSEAGVVNWLRRVINLPDTRAGWLPFGVDLGSRIGKDCQAIVSTAPPFTGHLIGNLIAHRYSIPHIADFRDVWVDFPYLPYYPWQKPIIRYLQDLVLKKADWITAAFDDIIDSFPERHRHKSTVIYNGFDPDDFQETKSPDVFTITHMGSITKRRRVDPVVEALVNVKDEIKEFRLRLIGYIHPDEKEKIGRVKGLEVLGYLDHQGALRKLQESSLLLLLNSPFDSPAPGRQAEYAATRLPITVIGHEGSCPILRKLERDKYPIEFIDYDDSGSLRRLIVESWTEWRKGRSKRYDGDLDFLDRRRQTGIFSQILDRLVR